MPDKIKMMGEALHALIEGRRIIARCELLHRIYKIVRDADLDTSERDELESMVGKRLAPGIFTNIMSGAPIFGLQGLVSSTTLHGWIFQNVDYYTRADYETAYNQFIDSKEELRELVILDLKTVLIDFMTAAGYHLDEESSKRIVFTNGIDQVDCLIYPSIKAIDLGNIGKSMVLLVPQHGESPEPFIAFYKEKGHGIEEAGLQVWVANLEGGTIDPFIGYPRDINIYKQFNNPKLAMKVRAIWGMPARPRYRPWWLPIPETS
jgi:hypothetical protein